MEDIVVVSPDAGGVKRAVSVSNKINTATAILHKERSRANVVDRMVLMGDVKGKVAVMVDDMIDTGGTACKAAQVLKDAGAKTVYLGACHGVLSKNAIERINDSVFTKVVVTNTLEINERFDQSPNKLDMNDAFNISSLLQPLQNTNKNDSQTKTTSPIKTRSPIYKGCNKIDILDVSTLCANAIDRSLTGQSLSELMDL